MSIEVPVFQNAQWIRHPSSVNQVNHYTLFRTTFTRDPAAGSIQLRIAAAGNFVCHVNGKLAVFGQYSDFPQYKTCHEEDLTPLCVPGANELEIAVYYSGNRFTSHVDGEPGLLAEILQDHNRVLTASQPGWLCAEDIRYRSGEMETLTGSLNYVFDFNAQKIPEFAPVAEAAPRPENCHQISLRPVPPVRAETFYAGKILSQGSLFRPRFISDTPETIAEVFKNDQCSDQQDIANPNGYFAVLDLGMEYAGILTLDVEADSNTICDIAHSEYLLNGHVPPLHNKRCFTDRYRSGNGRQVYRHYFRRLACRYLEIHIVGNIKAFRLHQLGIQETPPVLPAVPDFFCSDPFYTDARKVSLATLRLCMHEKYENCPWREQSICEYDARNQMLFGYPVWGNYPRAKAMLDIYAQSLRQSGFVPAAAPSATDLVIPSFTFLWLTAISEYVLYSGDTDVIAAYAPAIHFSFQKILSWKKDGLYVPPPDQVEPHLWNYCEAPALEFVSDPPNAFYNLYLHESLSATAELFRIAGDPDSALFYQKTADELGRLSETFFYDPDTGLYADHINSRGNREIFHGHIQMLFLERNLITDPRKKEKLFQAIQEGKVPFPALNTLPYLLKACFRYGKAKDRQYMARKIREIYANMLDQGAQTWWETDAGFHYGNGAGSLCHGWSATPLYYESSFILGITPLEPGCKKFLFKPYPGDLQHAKGSVRTPYGLIQVEWQQEQEGLQVHLICPPDCTAITENYPEAPIKEIRLEHQKILL